MAVVIELTPKKDAGSEKPSYDDVLKLANTPQQGEQPREDFRSINGSGNGTVQPCGR